MGFGSLSLAGRALRHLARREHSRAELERKLARELEHGTDAPAAAQIGAALDELAARGLLSDERAAQSVLASQGQRHGIRRLKHTLQAKGLAPELVDATLRQASETELDRAREVWRRRFGALPGSAPERARQLRFLSGRGFDAEVIHRILQSSDED
jgi:regulatory protein